jgi:hypothetical protein
MEHQDLETLALVHGIKHLLQVNEDTKERCLLQMRKLLSQLGFKDPCSCASPDKASMEAIAQNDGLQLKIH